MPTHPSSRLSCHVTHVTLIFACISFSGCGGRNDHQPAATRPLAAATSTNGKNAPLVAATAPVDTPASIIIRSQEQRGDDSELIGHSPEEVHDKWYWPLISQRLSQPGVPPELNISIGIFIDTLRDEDIQYIRDQHLTPNLGSVRNLSHI